MKSLSWIVSIFNILTFIGVRNDNEASASTLKMENSENSSAYVNDKFFHSYLSLDSVATTTTMLPSTLSNVWQQSRKLQKSIEKRSTLEKSSRECEPFTIGNSITKTFYSPGYPGSYSKNISCVKIIEAEPGHIIRLDFRDYFHIEQNDECKFDFLEVRDGAHGFSKVLGKFCGQNFPDIIESSDRFLWLHFRSDENIEYRGFKAVFDFHQRNDSTVYDDMKCGGTFEGAVEGYVNSSFISREQIQRVVTHNLHLECMWKIKVREGFKVLLYFRMFNLEKPNDCESNVIEIYGEEEIPFRLRKFCGFRADSVLSETNIVKIRFFTTATAINSSFSIVFTAFREKEGKDVSCRDDELDCEDQTCIRKELKCNGRENCRYGTDENVEKCKMKSMIQSEHMFIILVVFVVMLSIIIVAFMFNCFRKIVRDHKVIRDHIRSSHESKIDEADRYSIKVNMKNNDDVSFNHLTILQTTSFNDIDSKTTINVIDSDAIDNHQVFNSDMYPIRETEILSDKDFPELGNSMMFDTFLQQPQQQDNEGSITSQNDLCDTCQIGLFNRDSLFQPIFRNKVTQSPLPAGIRFSTFGYSDSSTPSPPILPPAGTMFSAPKNSSCQHHSHHHHYRHLPSSSSQKSESSDNSSMGTINLNDRQKRFIMKKDDSLGTSSSHEVRKSAPDVLSGCTSQQ